MRRVGWVFVWLAVFDFYVNLVCGAVVGAVAGAQARGFDAGSTAGRQAGAAFTQRFGGVILLFALVLAAAGTATGKLPWTRKTVATTA